MGASLEAARRELDGLLGDPPPGALLADRGVRALGRLIGHDGYCLFGVDPGTGLRSVMFSRNGLTVPTEVLLRNETIDCDANRYADLARSAVPVGTLTPAGTPQSRRLHELLPHDGYRSELRVALTTPGRYWGALSLFRGDAHRPFTDGDVASAHALAPLLTDVLRRYQVGRYQVGRHQVTRQDGTGPPEEPHGGTICLDARDQMVAVDGQAAAWLGTMTNHWDGGAVTEDLHRCVYEVAAAARRTDGGAAGHALARTRIADGSWLVLSGSYVGGSVVDVVVQLRSGDVATVLPAFAAWCGLTQREAQVLGLLVHGLAAKQVARRLGISTLTVGDHQRSLYRKAGVTGRDQLVSLLV